MIVRLILNALWLGSIASPVAAAPCVSKTFDRPLPGAMNVEWHVSDVPSAQFPAFWQNGIINGYDYTLFAPADGLLRSTDAIHDWEITITCNASAQTCEMTRDGDPPPDVESVSRLIGQCLLGNDLESVAPMPVAEIAFAADPPVNPEGAIE
jgi:hypothetical protein